ncbi:MAG: phosphatidate cytidylyltransferase [Brevinemataceae bacterium]
MLKRWRSALIGIPIVCFFISSELWNRFPNFLFLLALSLAVNTEIMLILKEKKTISYPFFIISVNTTLVSLLNYLFSLSIIDLNILLLLQICLFVISFYILIFKELIYVSEYSNKIENIGITLLMYITCVIIIPSMIILSSLTPNASLIIILMAFSWVSDACGLFVGKLFGKHILAMLPSQSKTLEGYLGSMVFSILLGVCFYYLQGILRLPFQWAMFKWITFGFLICLSSNFGDLTESLIKRWANTKDSGQMLPGMGGAFDALDSIIYSVPLLWVFFLF